MRGQCASRCGFTLVELALVLVIVGLIVGGVLVGQDLIKAATNVSQVRQIQQYDTAYNTFKLKYNCVPGDCKNAAGYWFSTVSGNGNGLIENNLATYYDASGSITWTASAEYRYFFVELAQAGFVADPSDGTAVVGKGMPKLKYKPSSSFFASDTQSFQVLTAGSSRVPDINNYRRGNNALWFTACNVSGDSPWLWDDDCGIFRGLDLSSIDQKIDDGMPLSGRLFGFGGASTQNNCLTGNAYNIAPTTPQCLAAFILD